MRYAIIADIHANLEAVLSTLDEEQGTVDFYTKLGWVANGRYVDRDGHAWVRMTRPL